MSQMYKRLLIHREDDRNRVKEIAVTQDPKKLKKILNGFTWKILSMLSEEEMYPLEIARELGVHEQRIYYHIRKLEEAGAIEVARKEKKKGATAKYYQTVSQAFGIELPEGYRAMRKLSPLGMDERIPAFFEEFITQEGVFQGKVVVGSPKPHGPFKTSARDGHYSSYLTFFLGQFITLPDKFMIKLDVDVKAEKEEKNNLLLVGGPGTNLVTQKVNEYLPIRFNMRPSEDGFLFGGLVSRKTSQVYTADGAGLIAKIVNPWDSNKRVIVLAGNKAVGTKACVLAVTKFWEKILKDYQGGDSFATVIRGFDLDGDGKVDSIDILE
ncbi:MAG: helix-turn-helix domain-containing protein [Thermoproteota archaeon]